MPDDIQRYRQKRDFDHTPEPTGRPARRRKRRLNFVVHRHEARRLHYDLRLEMDGVLKSWAVPKIFSYNPADKRLAIRTEDHPLEYETFEGVIPAGQYGAGTMMIWDRGPYQVLNGDPLEALEAGKLELQLAGSRLRGQWHMVKLKKEPNQWLIFKSRDTYARGPDEPVFALDLTRTRRGALPQRLRKMQPGSRVAPFEDPEWIFELQLSGLRVFVEKRGPQIRFRGTNRKRLEQRLPDIVNDLQNIKAEVAILDGVLVCLDDQQRPSQTALEDALAGRTEQPIHLYVFDLLYYEEWDLRAFPLIERKSALASLLPDLRHVIRVTHERSQSSELMRQITEAGLGGCLAKRAASAYAAGASEDWREIDLSAAAATPSQPVTVHDAYAGVRVTNRQKVLWPRDGYTKGDLLEYYDRVADFILPYLAERPLSLHRFPDGIEGESFFQKNAPPHLPDWICTAEVSSRHGRRERIRFVVCDQRRTLLYLANLACIELHPFSSRTAHLDDVDWAILDLDPSSDDYAPVARLARETGKLLRGIGLRPYIKTSGARGLHIYVPLRRGYTYDQARMFCEAVARTIAHRHPDIATIERAKPRRGKRVYLDFLQNRRGQTIVSPYSLRPRPGAPVSMPLDWDEVSVDHPPSRFTMQTAPARLQRLGDLFQGVLTDPQDLLPAIAALQELVR